MQLDTSTVTNAPEGFAFAGPAKPFHSIAGQASTLNHGVPFDIYLPLYKVDEVIEIDSGEVTVGKFGESSLDHLATIMPDVPREEWEQNFSIEVPADTLFFEDGSPATELRLFALDKDQIPAPLPENIDTDLVFSVEAGGAKQFDAPSQMTFPNTDKLAPGERRPIFSFDHNLGEWVLTGFAVVSQDGARLETESGGINTLGWKTLGKEPQEIFSAGGNSFPPGPLPPEPDDEPLEDCSLDDVIDKTIRSIISSAEANVRVFWELGKRALPPLRRAAFLGGKIKKFAAEKWETAVCIVDFLKTSNLGRAQILLDKARAEKKELLDFNDDIQDFAEKFLGAVDLLKARRAATQALLDRVELISDPCFLGDSSFRRLKRNLEKEIRAMDDAIANWRDYYGGRIEILDALLRQACIAFDRTEALIISAIQKLELGEQKSSRNTKDNEQTLDEIKIELEKLGILLEECRLKIDGTSGGVNDGALDAKRSFDKMQSEFSETNRDFRDLLSRFLVNQSDILHYAVRGESATKRGSAPLSDRLFISMSPLKDERVEFYIHKSKVVWAAETVVASLNDNNLDKASTFFSVEFSIDSDNDGISDLAEEIVGTLANNADTDEDGILDGAELDQGLNPLDGIGFPTGIVASLAMPGESKDTFLVGESSSSRSTTVYVATGSHGLAIVDASQFNSPVLLGCLDLPGIANAVVVNEDQTLAFVAAGGAGLHIVDVVDPLAPSLVNTLRQYGAVNQLEVLDGAIALAAQRLVLIDSFAGDVILDQSIENQAGKITDLEFSGGSLYAISGNQRLHSLTLSGDVLLNRDHINIPVPPVRRLRPQAMRVFVANGVAYVSNGLEVSSVAASRPLERGGYVTFDVSNSDELRLISNIDTGDFQAGNLQTVLNGSGLALIAGGFRGLEVHDSLNPEVTYDIVTAYPTPGRAEGVASVGGIAYVADGAAGLQVINYRDFDALGIPPTVSIALSEIDVDLETAGVQVEEGTTVRFEAVVTDDVQARSVTLLINGEALRQDLSYPYELAYIVPNLSPEQPSVEVKLQATDTGGNVSVSDSILLEIVPDITPPEIVKINPDDVALIGLDTVSISFSESVDLDSVSLNDVTITNEDGGDSVMMPISLSSRADQRVIDARFADGLPEGDYALHINQSAVADRAGNLLGEEVLSLPFEIVEATAFWNSPTGGEWSNPNNWRDGQVPGPDDAVLISVDDGVQVFHRSGEVKVARLTVRGGFSLRGGTLEAGILEIREGDLIATRGTIRNSVILSPDGSGIRVGPATSASLRLDSVALNADLIISGDGELEITGGLVLNSELTIASGTTTTARLNFAGGTQQVDGSGEIVFGGDPESPEQNEITTTNTNSSASEKVTVGSDIEIRGGNGLLNAASLSDSLTVLGPIITENDGTIFLNDLNHFDENSENNRRPLLFDSRDGTIIIHDEMANIILRPIGESVLTVPGNRGALFNTELEAELILTGDLLEIHGDFTLNSDLTLAAQGDAGVNLRFEGGPLVVDGEGAIVFGGSPGNGNQNVVSINNTNGAINESVTLGEGIVFRGTLGRIDSNSSDGFQGILNLDDPDGGIELIGRFAGLELNSESGFRVGSAGTTWDNVTLNTDVTIVGPKLEIVNGLTLNSTLTLAARTDQTSVELNFAGGIQLVDGSGEIIFGGNPETAEQNEITTTNTVTSLAERVTLGPDIEVRGGRGILNAASLSDSLTVLGPIITENDGTIFLNDLNHFDENSENNRRPLLFDSRDGTIIIHDEMANIILRPIGESVLTVPGDAGALFNTELEADLILTGGLLEIHGDFTLNSDLTLAAQGAGRVDLRFEGGPLVVDGEGAIVFGGSPSNGNQNVVSINNTNGAVNESVTLGEGIGLRGGLGSFRQNDDSFVVRGAIDLDRFEE